MTGGNTFAPSGVIAGLDPAIRPLRHNFYPRRWMRGSSPRMTNTLKRVRRGGADTTKR
jgi:hypothetical protein